MCDILYRSADTVALFCLLVSPGGLHPTPGLVECDSAIGGLTEQCVKTKVYMQGVGKSLHGLGYLKGSYDAFGSCNCWTIYRI